MSKISCDACLDLIPLVRDNVASQDSRDLVLEHIDQCQSCREELERMTSIPQGVNDRRVLQKMKKQIFYGAFAIIIIGTLIGIGLSESSGMFYNIIIFPLVGGITYLVLNRKAIYFTIGLFIFSYIWTLIKYSIDSSFAKDSILNLLFAPTVLSSIYAALTLLGVIIAFLLKFAFRKEENMKR